jgi:hypothetical protein
MTQRESIAEGEARSRTERMCGNFSYGYDEKTVLAMLTVIADYARASGMSSEHLRSAHRSAGTHFSSAPTDVAANRTPPVAVRALAEEIAHYRGGLRPEASRVAGALLRLAADTFVNHGCGDFDLAAVVPDVGERRVIMRAVEAWSGNPEPDPAGEYRVAQAWRLMRFLGEWLRGAPVERGIAETNPATAAEPNRDPTDMVGGRNHQPVERAKPPSLATEVTLPRHRFLDLLDEMFCAGAHFGRENPQHRVADSIQAAAARVAEVMAALDAHLRRELPLAESRSPASTAPATHAEIAEIEREYEGKKPR